MPTDEGGSTPSGPGPGSRGKHRIVPISHSEAALPSRTYRDPFSGKTYLSERSCENAVARDHAPQLAALGVTAAQAMFSYRNRLPLATRRGKSVISGLPTDWNERAGRYERFHDESERAEYRKQFLDRMQRVHGKEHLLDDPLQQRLMLAGRKISGSYTFRDGSVRTYTGQYERDLLEFLDHGLGWPGADVQCPAPQDFPYEGEDGKRHVYIPDAWIESLNLIVEVKAADNRGYRLRDIDVEQAKDRILGTSGYNYVKVMDRSYGDLVDEIARIRREEEDSAPDPLAPYEARRDFSSTPEPAPERAPPGGALAFVVQEHNASSLHWDFRLEQDGVLWSWAVPKGVPLSPGDKRLAVRTEDHPLGYGTFEGTIPAGQYGAGTVKIWDSGSWAPRGDPAAGIAAGLLKFDLAGRRLSGGYTLVRLKPRPGERGENWLLIKEGSKAGLNEDGDLLAGDTVAGAIRGVIPHGQPFQLARDAAELPPGDEWLVEIKYDGYRVMVRKSGRKVELLSRGGNDWAAKYPDIVAWVLELPCTDAVIDGEIVAEDPETKVSNFALLQAGGPRANLFLQAFDILQLNGWDLRGCRLDDRKDVLRRLGPKGRVRYSPHAAGGAGERFRSLVGFGQEGVVCKRADSTYGGNRDGSWLKKKRQGREDLLVLGWDDPESSRVGLGALHLGYRDTAGDLHYAGAVGSGFTDAVLGSLRPMLDAMPTARPKLTFAGDPPPNSVHWVRPELVAAVKFLGWSDAGRLRQAVFMGIRTDAAPSSVILPPGGSAQRRSLGAGPAPRTGDEPLWDGTITSPAKELWSGITKLELADYWSAVAEFALPELANRPLAILRGPDGIGGGLFFQKNLYSGFPLQVRGGVASGHPYLTVGDAAGLRALAQMSALEVHAWGSSLADPMHPDTLVFDLDAGGGVAFNTVIEAALALRPILEGRGLVPFCRTTGSEGLHVVVPLVPRAGWEAALGFSKSVAAEAATARPDLFSAGATRSGALGRVAVDWLRQGLGATSVASYSPRAIRGAPVAFDLRWEEVVRWMEPMHFTISTVPGIISRRGPAWKGFRAAARALPAY
jgi:bifunctional non-homologous end joining protein LigD